MFKAVLLGLLFISMGCWMYKTELRLEMIEARIKIQKIRADELEYYQHVIWARFNRLEKQCSH